MTHSDAGSPPSAAASVFLVRPRRRHVFLKAFTMLLVLAAAGYGLYWYAAVRELATVYKDDADHFKYGTIGNEAVAGVPYWVWIVLPRAFCIAST